MSSTLLLAVVLGQVVLALAGLALSGLVRQLQVDARRPGALIERPDSRAAVVRPPELEAMQRLVGDSITSEATAERQLGPVLAQLARQAPGGRVTVEPPPGRDRRRWIAETLAALEAGWGITADTEGRRSRRP
ncbi:MAG: hypothetical protein OEY41_01990 [Acidimicrobiia bacterium]|nr:hypothetical protein [Acidimicrobiia bacterium]MDH5288747.1 hypothetical protein [Acidimicrobiia bacterium]